MPKGSFVYVSVKHHRCYNYSVATPKHAAGRILLAAGAVAALCLPLEKQHAGLDGSKPGVNMTTPPLRMARRLSALDEGGAMMLSIPLERLETTPPPPQPPLVGGDFSLDRLQHGFLRSRRLAHERVALRSSLGTHYLFAHVGTPPQRVSLIVDTGSYTLAFPCAGCDECRVGQRQAFWDPQLSETATEVGCDECQLPYKCSSSHPRCSFRQAYSEGSSWTAYQMNDVVRLGGKELVVGQEEEDELYSRNAVNFGCIRRQSGMFDTQAADGIIGLAPHQDSVLWQMADLMPPDSKKFSLCFSPHGGNLVMGGFDPMLLEPGEYHEYTPAKVDGGWFSVKVEGVLLGGTQIATQKTLELFELGTGVIVDSGTTDTYLPQAIASEWHSAWLATSKTPFQNCIQENFCMNLSTEEIKTLPTLSVALADGVTLSLTAKEYMEAGPRVEGGRVSYAPRIYLTEYAGGVLGANMMMNRNVLFDASNERVGFAKARCDYDDSDKRARARERKGVNIPGPVKPNDFQINVPVDAVPKNVAEFVSAVIESKGGGTSHLKGGGGGDEHGNALEGRTPVSAEQSALDDTEKTKKVSGGAAESGNPEVTDDDEKSMSTRSDTHERNESPAVIDGEERTHEGRGGQEDAAQRLARGREGAGEGGDVSKGLDGSGGTAGVEDEDVDCEFELVEASPCEVECPPGLESPQMVVGFQKFHIKIVVPAKGGGNPCPENEGAENHEALQIPIKMNPCEAVCQPIVIEEPEGTDGRRGEGEDGQGEEVPAVHEERNGRYTNGNEELAGSSKRLQRGEEAEKGDGEADAGRGGGVAGPLVVEGVVEAVEAVKSMLGGDIGDRLEIQCSAPIAGLWSRCGASCKQQRFKQDGCSGPHEVRSCDTGELCPSAREGIYADITFKFYFHAAATVAPWTDEERSRLLVAHAMAEALGARLHEACHIGPGSIEVALLPTSSGDGASEAGGRESKNDHGGSMVVSASVHVLDSTAITVPTSMRFELDNHCITTLGDPAIASDLTPAVARELGEMAEILTSTAELAELIEIVEVGGFSLRSASSGARTIDNATPSDLGASNNTVRSHYYQYPTSADLRRSPGSPFLLFSSTVVFAVQVFAIVAVIGAIFFMKRWRMLYCGNSGGGGWRTAADMQRRRGIGESSSGSYDDEGREAGEYSRTQRRDDRTR